MTKLDDYLLALASDASPDGAADYVMTYDDSAGVLKKVLLGDLPGGGGGSWVADFQQTAYATAISLGTATDGSVVDVDATNAKISFTPAASGKYKVTFQFSHYTKVTAVDVVFRITDGVTDSPLMEVYRAATGTDSQSIYTLSYVFTWAAAAQTIKLQKQITVWTGGTSPAHQIVGLVMLVERIGS